MKKAIIRNGTTGQYLAEVKVLTKKLRIAEADGLRICVERKCEEEGIYALLDTSGSKENMLAVIMDYLAQYGDKILYGMVFGIRDGTDYPLGAMYRDKNDDLIFECKEEPLL